MKVAQLAKSICSWKIKYLSQQIKVFASNDQHNHLYFLIKSTIQGKNFEFHCKNVTVSQSIWTYLNLVSLEVD